MGNDGRIVGRIVYICCSGTLWEASLPHILSRSWRYVVPPETMCLRAYVNKELKVYQPQRSTARLVVQASYDA
mgnify:CR=1 FL=1